MLPLTDPTVHPARHRFGVPGIAGLLLASAIGCSASPAPHPAPALLVAPAMTEPGAGLTPTPAATAEPRPPEALTAEGASAEPPPGVQAPPEAPSATKPDGPRIGALRPPGWIYAEASRSSRILGSIREGTSVALKSGEKVAGQGCPGGWFAAEPYGFVCLDRAMTRSTDDPSFAALAAAAPRRDQGLPYHYAFSTGAPMYRRVPSRQEQNKVEGTPERRPKPPKLGIWASSHQELTTEGPIAATESIPAFLVKPPGDEPPALHLVRKWIPNGSMLAYSRAFEAEGRIWLLSPDLTIVPGDRVRPFRTSTFHGVALGTEVKLPLAWARHDAVPTYKKTEGGFVPTGETLPPRTFVALSGEREGEGARAYLATRAEGVFVRESEVSVARPRDRLPAALKPDQKWIDVHIRAGTLVAYVGMSPVFTTLVSPGAGGVGPFNATNEELVKLSATPLGVYRVAWKIRAAAMSPETGEPEKFWIADVPHTQYFRPPFAIHTAYWHEDFGMPKSAGCINVSPEDGRYLYDWTDPVTPADWQASATGKEGGVGTVVVIVP